LEKSYSTSDLPQQTDYNHTQWSQSQPDHGKKGSYSVNKSRSTEIIRSVDSSEDEDTSGKKHVIVHEKKKKEVVNPDLPLEKRLEIALRRLAGEDEDDDGKLYKAAGFNLGEFYVNSWFTNMKDTDMRVVQGPSFCLHPQHNCLSYEINLQKERAESYSLEY
jgi:hypothetical protein